jgi:hypothetical protein
MRTTTVTLLLLLLLVVPASAQVSLPRVSPAASVSQTIGTTEVTIVYHRPGVKERDIWGGLVPYGQPWRMGANEATTIEFSDAVKIDGNEVPAGKYSLFAIPGPDTWTLVINEDPNQWGAYGYDQEKDALRLDVRPVAAPHTEWMRFTIDPAGTTSAVVRLNWESLSVPMTVEVEVDQIVWKKIDSTLASTYAGAAAFALESGQRLEEGLFWADRSIESGANIFNLWTKARLLQKVGRSGEAVPVMERVLTMARGNVPQDFLDVLEGSMASIRADAGSSSR